MGNRTSFNPRTRESATTALATDDGRGIVSIHALVRVRLESLTGGALATGFNPRTRESATHRHSTRGLLMLVSIHALVRVRLVIQLRW